MSAVVYVCELCGYRGTSPLICTSCDTELIYINKENAYCSNCDRYVHGLENPCDGCGHNLGPGEVHFEPL